MKVDDGVRRRLEKRLKRDESTGCLLWTGPLSGRGYGRIRIGDRLEIVHRVAFVLAGGKITAEKPHVLHSCPFGDEKRCCEPSHLRAGTNAENMKDVAIRGQGPKSRRGLPFGVRRERSGRFTAQARIDGTIRSFGTYDAWQEASAIAFLHKNLALNPELGVN